jgi:hypothetical protein
LDAVAYGPFDRANGMRLPPSTATRRTSETMTTSVLIDGLRLISRRLRSTYS